MAQKNIRMMGLFVLKCYEIEGGARSRGSRNFSICSGEVFMSLIANVILFAKHIFTVRDIIALSLFTMPCLQVGQSLLPC